MRTCKRCGTDISHKGPTAKYCGRNDGDGSCFKARAKVARDKSKERRGKGERFKVTLTCQWCGREFETSNKNAKTCSKQCFRERQSDIASQKRNKESAKEEILRQRKINDMIEKDLELNGPRWPYKMPFDKEVNPSDMCPLG